MKHTLTGSAHTPRLIALLCALTLLLGMITVPAGADGATAWVVTANRGALNLRSAPSADAEVIGKINYGTKVTVLNYINSTWMYVQVRLGGGNASGYVMSRYLSYTSPYASATSTPAATAQTTGAVSIDWSGFQSVTPYKVTIRPTKTTGWVNLRWAPDINVDVIERLYNNYQMVVIATNGVWAQAIDPNTNKVGFFMLQYSARTGYGAVISVN